MKGYIAFVTLEHEPLIIAAAAQGARASVMLRGTSPRPHPTTCVDGGLNRRRYRAPACRAALRAAFRPRLGWEWRPHAADGRIRPQRRGINPGSLRRDARHDRSKTAGACPELRLASRHHPGGQQGDAGGGVRSDPYCGVWLATSHLLSSLLAAQRLTGRPRDPSSMACAAAAYTAPCTWPGHAGGGGGCSASKAAYVLERSCSTAKGVDQEWGGVPRIVVSSSRAERRVGLSSAEYTVRRVRVGAS